MALTPSRWIALAALGFVLAPVIIFSRNIPDPYKWSERDRLQSRAGRAQSRLRSAAERIYTDRLIDSVLRSVPPAPGASLRVTYDRALDSTPRRLLSEIARDATRDRPATSRVGTDIHFVVDSVQTVDGVQRRGFTGALSVNYVLPKRGTAERCVVVARVKPWGLNEFASEASRDRLLGPCRFYETFGAPGPQLQLWLANGGWAFAQSTTSDATSWKRWYMRDDVPLRYLMSSRGVACAKGNRSACDEALQEPDVTGWQMRRTLLMTEYNPYIMTSGWYSREWSFGPRSTALLADMAEDLGTDRFTRFWQSDLAPQAAFRAAADQEMSDWARSWIVRTYHEESAGPGVSGSAWGWGLALLALSLGLILRSAERRQMA